MTTYPEAQQSNLGEAHLWVCSGKNIGRRFALDKPQISIGRSEDADIVVVDERVSQQHALIERDEEQRHVVKDLGSTNGTIVNNQKVDRASLQDGDLIQVGETVFEYLTQQESSPTTIAGQASDTATDAVPAELRFGARQILEQARHNTDAPAVPRNDTQRVVADPAVGALSAISAPRPGPGGGFMPAPPVYGHGTVPPPHMGGMGAYGNAPGMGYPMVPHGMPPGTMAPAQWDERAGVLMGDEDEEEDEGGGFNPKMILERLLIARDIFLPYWKSVLFFLIVGASAGVAYFKLKPPPSTAVFEISLTRGLSKNPLGGEAQSNVTFFKSAEISFRSSGLIAKTLAELGEPNAPPDRLATIQEQLVFASLGPPIPNTYAGAFSAQDSNFALKFLETHVGLYLETEVEKTLREIKASADFLEGRLEEIRKKLRTTESDLTDFKKQNIQGLPDQARETYAALFSLQGQETQAMMELSRVRASLKMINDLLRTEKPIITTRIRTNDAVPSAIVDAQQSLARERAAGKGEEHPDIIKLKKRLVQLRKLAQQTAQDPTMREEATNPNYVRLQDQQRQLSLQEQAARKQLGYVRQELARINDLVTKLPELEATHSELTRSYGSTQKLYRQMSDEFNRIELQLEIERAQAKARYDIITAPKLEYIAVNKRMAKKAGMGAVAGLVFGLLLAGLRQFRKNPDQFRQLIKGPPEPEEFDADPAYSIAPGTEAPQALPPQTNPPP